MLLHSPERSFPLVSAALLFSVQPSFPPALGFCCPGAQILLQRGARVLWSRGSTDVLPARNNNSCKSLLQANSTAVHLITSQTRSAATPVSAEPAPREAALVVA